MLFVQCDDMVDALATDCPDQPLGKTVLPRRAERNGLGVEPLVFSLGEPHKPLWGADRRIKPLPEGDRNDAVELAVQHQCRDRDRADRPRSRHRRRSRQQRAGATSALPSLSHDGY